MDFPLNTKFIIDFSQIGLVMLRYVSSTLFLQDLYPEGLLIFSKAFSASVKVTM